MPNQHTSGWNHETVKRLFELHHEAYNFSEIAQILSKEYHTFFTETSVKTKFYRERDNEHDLMNDTYEPHFEETIKHKANGEIEHDKLVQLTEEEAKSKQRVMELCGYDPNEWQVVDCEVGFWTYRDKENPDGKISRKCKLKVKPRENTFDFDKLLEALENRPVKEPIPFKGTQQEEKTYLEIPLYDLHFGIADIDFYQETLQKTLELLQKSYKEVLIPIGQDLFHNNDFKGQTANGTKIDQVDMVKATDDAEQFYITIIDEAVKNSEKVTIVYSKGNHDEVPSYYFTRGLRHLYRNDPRVVFDIELKERKAFMLGKVFLGITHGDKNRNNLAANFSVEFPELWAKATTRECHIGHLHRKRTTKKNIEIIHDKDGLIVRELGTGNETDNYHEDNGYNLAHKEFEIFEYSETRKKHIHYV